MGVKSKNGKLIQFTTLNGILLQSVYAGYNSSPRLQLFINYMNEIASTEGAVKLFREIVKRTSAKKLSETNKELAKYREDITSIDSKLNNALEALLEGKIDASEKARYSEALVEKRSQIEQQVAELEKIQRINETTIAYVCNFITKPAKLWRDADLETRQAFQKTMFPKDHVSKRLIFRYRGTKIWNGRFKPTLLCYLQQKRVKR